jgi:hypothetical protein
VKRLMSSPIYNGPIYNRSGAHVGYVAKGAVFDVAGNKLYELDGADIIDMSTNKIVGRSPTGRPPRRLDPTTREPMSLGARFLTIIGSGPSSRAV